MFADMPNPDERILFLNKRLRARENRAMDRLTQASDDLAGQTCQAKGRVVAFSGAALASPLRRLRPADVISLATGRAARTQGTALHGRFRARLPEPTG